MANYEEFKLKHSLKNIPIANRNEIKMMLVEKVSHLIRRMRLKAHFFLEGPTEGSTEPTYGFKSKFLPKTNKHLAPFENDLIDMAANIEFRQVSNKFQNELREDVKRIKRTKNVIVASDKTSNFYQMTREQYSKLVKDNVTAKYKKADENEVNEINKEAKEVTKELRIHNRINKLPLREAYVTLKDHKANFATHPTCRLINPTKSEVGKVAKHILDNINKVTRERTNLNQWTNTDQVLSWFEKLERGKYSFLKMDVVDFYPSITRSLLDKALNFARSYVNIDEEEKAIIYNSCRSVLYSNYAVWQKRESQNADAAFDVTMGSFNGAEICELVGLYMLQGLNQIIGDGNIGLYRDDSLAAIPIQSAFKTEKLKKAIHAFAKSNGLKVTIEAPVVKTDFLDVVLDLRAHTYAPYKKPNAKIMYVNASSNHPSNIIDQIPRTINRRLSKRSSTRKEFDEIKPEYDEILNKCGYRQKLSYNEDQTPDLQKKKRRRKIIWFNPPFCKSVKTNIGRRFMNLVKKHFTKQNPLTKIFNEHNMRYSYCCMKNMDAVIKAHNRAILKDEEDTTPACNCAGECMLRDQKYSCRTKGVVYKATVTSEQESKSYIGLASTTFKQRYANHKSSFKLTKKRNATALSQHIWELKEKNINYEISWEILKRVRPKKSGERKCLLCVNEATMILFANDDCLLNKRREIVSSCRHEKDLLLVNVL